MALAEGHFRFCGLWPGKELVWSGQLSDYPASSPEAPGLVGGAIQGLHVHPDGGTQEGEMLGGPYYHISCFFFFLGLSFTLCLWHFAFFSISLVSSSHTSYLSTPLFPIFSTKKGPRLLWILLLGRRPVDQQHHLTDLDRNMDFQPPPKCIE